MSDNDNQSNKEVLEYTTEIVAAHVSNNTVAVPDLPDLIQQVYRTLASVESTSSAMQELKRHLKTAYNMTPDEYRERWGLASDYPMVAPSYAAQRSTLAKKIGLGTRARRGTVESSAA